VLEQAAEHRADAARCHRRAVGVLHLAEDLRLPEHHRVETARDAEQVAHDLAVAQLVDLARGRAAVAELLAQEPVHELERVVARAGRAEQLGAVAGREERALVEPRLGEELGGALREVDGRDRVPLAHRHGRGPVRQADEEQVHGAAPIMWMPM
jgi:hypothetical protein